MKEIDDDSPMFEFGDQDYGSAIGWQPWGPTANEIKEAQTPQMLLSQPVSTWLKMGADDQPAEQLFGPFWKEGELALLFAPSGVGKSALAVQIAESLARGLLLPPFGSGHRRPQRVLYLDFELDQLQLTERYSLLSDDGRQFDAPYDFSSDLIRSVMYWDGRVLDGYKGFSDMFFCSIADEIDRYDAGILIVDNITFLDRTSTANVNTAHSIMRSLNELKRQKAVSILVLAHATKRRKARPMVMADLQGSINLANFADSIFAMGSCRRDKASRYLKQIKVRTGRLEYGDDNVPLFSLEKFDAAAALGLVQNTTRTPVENFLGLRFEKFDEEMVLLEPRETTRFRSQFVSPARRKNVELSVMQLAKKGKSIRFIAGKLGVPKTTVARYMKAV